MAEVYLVLGLPGSGRGEVVQDLIENGLPEDATVAICHAESEPLRSDGKALNPRVKLAPFVFKDGQFDFSDEDGPPENAKTVFFLTDGKAPVIDQIEAFPVWMGNQDLRLARILLVVDCALAASNPKASEWHEACVHFADCVLLNNRQGVPQQWIKTFIKKFQDARFPCLFVYVKNGRVDNALVVLFPEARRISLVFDELEPLDAEELDEDDLPEDGFTVESKPDPYFERKPSGHRKKAVPDTSTFLPS